MSDWKWFAGDNKEVYRVGPCDSREAAIAEARERDLGLRYKDGEPAGYTIELIEALQDPIDLSDWIEVDFDHIHERLGDDFGGEDSESPADGCWTEAQEAELVATIKQAVAAWQARHAIVVVPHRFTASRHGVRIEFTPAAQPPEDEPAQAAE